MTKWQRRARLAIGVFAVAFLIVVLFAFKRRHPSAPPAAVVRTDPGAVVESTGGRVTRVTLAREDVSVEYEKQLTYADGSTKMMGVTVVTTEKSGRRTFTVTGKEGQLGQNEQVISLHGDVRLAASDGLTARTEHATYAQKDGLVRAKGPVEFARGRLAGRGVGMTYDENADALTILDKAAIHVAADPHGAGGADATSGTATFARREHEVRFGGGMHLQRSGQIIDAEEGVAFLTPDEGRVTSVDLHGHARIAASAPAAGALQDLSGETMNLRYADDADVLQQVTITGGSVMQIAGAGGAQGRRITGNVIEITLAPDGSTPTALTADQAVQLTSPADRGGATQSVRADHLEATGPPDRGLTRAQFTGSVDYREKSPSAERTAQSQVLDLALEPGMGEINEAKFARSVRFKEGAMSASAAVARYVIKDGTLELSGTEPASRTPRVVNDQIKVDAAHINLTLAGPKMKAAGSVQSELQPPKKTADSPGARLPSMLKQDEPVNVTAKALDYDGTSSRAVYTGAAQLWQQDTSVKGDSITIDDKSGDLSASGSVTTTSMLEQTNKDNKKERVRSVATSAEFTYEEALRRATYTGSAHMIGPQGEMTAEKIELYLKESGDEIDRAEAYDAQNKLSLREQERTTTGSHLTYTSADDQYVVTGTPVKIVDNCRRETTGRTLIFHRATDSIVVDGNGFRTQTRGGGSCR